MVMAAMGVDEFTHIKYSLKSECKTELRDSSEQRKDAKGDSPANGKNQGK